MSKPKKSKAVALKKVRDPEREAARRRASLRVLGVCLFLGILGGASYISREYVAKKIAFPSDPPRVVLVNRPAWMSDLLAEEIVRNAKPAGAHSAFEHQLLVDINRILCADPWIKSVRQVRRVYVNRPGDTIEIDCDYRAPVALVQWGKSNYWLVDGEGVRLPPVFNGAQLDQVVKGADRKVNIRVITNVLDPPPAPGKKWPGQDLQAGLDMVKVLYGLPYAEEIVTVDVKNFGHRDSLRDVQLALGTIRGTTVKWGRPINGGNDFFTEPPTERKLQVMKQIFEQCGHVDADQPWVDIHLDIPTYPSTNATGVAKGQ